MRFNGPKLASLAPAAERTVTVCELRERRSSVPPKIRELVADLQAAGFVDRGGRAAIETLFIRRSLDR